MELGTYIMASEPIYVYRLSLLGNGSIKKLYRSNEYTRKDIRILGCVVCYEVRVVSRKAGDYSQLFPELLF